MKRLFYLGVMAFMTCIISCSRTIYPSAEVNYLSGTEQTISVRVVGVGTNEEQAIINAEQKVFDVLFFRGLPESQQKMPMVGSDESAEKSKNKKYFNQLYNGQRHKTFVMSSIPVSGLTKAKEGKSITVDVKINLSSLRSDLEKFGVIRKFGL
ncbi:hypothetical protein [Sphingobacterium lumbrici]|uniref:hypothetical protein n=1 Tax=Sphingobacterium lumbrici TaxID=2559600 RepID=UPI00112AE518|nr:hypothetical protein [Sphingobacterium lumbrici]